MVLLHNWFQVIMMNSYNNSNGSATQGSTKVDCSQDRTKVDFIQLAQKFGDSSTLHGIQYVIGTDKHFLRRYIDWIWIFM